MSKALLRNLPGLTNPDLASATNAYTTGPLGDQLLIALNDAAAMGVNLVSYGDALTDLGRRREPNFHAKFTHLTELHDGTWNELRAQSKIIATLRAACIEETTKAIKAL